MDYEHNEDQRAILEGVEALLSQYAGPARAIELGYEKALSAILDANITTFITAVILAATVGAAARKRLERRRHRREHTSASACTWAARAP